MRRDLENRLSRLEGKTFPTFTVVFVRSNNWEETDAELDRLKQAGLASGREIFVSEPRGTDEISSKIVEWPIEVLHLMLREINQMNTGKRILDEASVNNTCQKYYKNRCSTPSSI